MDTIWTIMSWIVNIFELSGLVFLLIFTVLAVTNPGYNKRIDKVRNYILMLDEEDLYESE